MIKFCKLALSSVAVVAAMCVFMCDMTQTAAAEEQIFYVGASKLLPTVIANDSSQTIAKLLVRDRDADRGLDSVYDWNQIENCAAYDRRKGIVCNIVPGQWAQYNISQEKQITVMGDDTNQRLVDIQVTLADGRVLELDRVDVCTKDIVLTDEGLMVVSIAKTPSPSPSSVNAGSNYFHKQQPQGRKAAESAKEIPQGYALMDGQLVKWE